MALAYQTWFEAFVKAIDPAFELVTTEENGTVYIQSVKNNIN